MRSSPINFPNSNETNFQKFTQFLFRVFHIRFAESARENVRKMWEVWRFSLWKVQWSRGNFPTFHHRDSTVIESTSLQHTQNEKWIQFFSRISLGILQSRARLKRRVEMDSRETQRKVGKIRREEKEKKRKFKNINFGNWVCFRQIRLRRTESAVSVDSVEMNFELSHMFPRRRRPVDSSSFFTLGWSPACVYEVSIY